MSAECPKFHLENNRDNIVRGVYGLQETLSVWQHRAYPDGQTPEQQTWRASEEWRELVHEAVFYDETPESRHNIEQEAADMIIGCIGVVIAAGGNLAPALARKLGILVDKYDVNELEQMHAQGYDQKEALKARKTIYQAPANMYTVDL